MNEMEIALSTPPRGAAAQTSGPTAGDAASSEGISADFRTFLQMLTAQARYQDPLEPIDSTEYAAQLAQFSMVEQQVKTNDTLEDLAAQLGVSNMASMSGWIGKDVRVQGAATFDGTPVTLSYAPATGAESATLLVRDDRGQDVQRISVPLSGGTLQWAGVDETGSPFPPGTYSFHVLSVSRGETIGQSQAAFYGRVAEVRLRDGEAVLILDSGQEILATSVDAIRGPDE